MFQNIFQTVIMGSNTIFLDIPQMEYFSQYDSLTKESAEDIAKKYFTMKGKEGTPHIKEMEVDSGTRKIKLTLEVDGSSNLIFKGK